MITERLEIYKQNQMAITLCQCIHGCGGCFWCMQPVEKQLKSFERLNNLKKCTYICALWHLFSKRPPVSYIHQIKCDSLLSWKNQFLSGSHLLPYITFCCILCVFGYSFLLFNGLEMMMMSLFSFRWHEILCFTVIHESHEVNPSDVGYPLTFLKCCHKIVAFTEMFII